MYMFSISLPVVNLQALDHNERAISSSSGRLRRRHVTTLRFSPCLFALILALTGTSLTGGDSATGEFHGWVVRPEIRITPASFSRELKTTAHAEAFRNEVVSLQFAVRAPQPLESFSTHCGYAVVPPGQPEPPRLPCSWVQIRYPGYVLVDEIGQYVSDPLFADPPKRIEPNWTQPIWLTIHVPRTADPGVYVGKLGVTTGSQSATLTIELRVLDFTLPDLPEGAFYLNIWQDPAAVARWAKVPMWSEEHWKLLEAYARDLAVHGQKSITTGILHDPWRSQTGNVFPSMVEWRFPGEWQLGQEAKFQFDYTVFDRYVELMMRAGVKKSIHCFSLVDGPGHSPDCDIGYVDTRTGQLRIRHTTVGDHWYEKAWGVFLPAFVNHLKERGWLDRTYIAFDEKPQDILSGIMAVLRSAAPDLKVALAGGSSSQESADAGDLTIHWDDLSNRTALEQLHQKRRGVGPTVFYTACAPYSPNTFLYSPLWESRMLPWISFRYSLNGYLRWAYQSWPEAVWQQPRFRWHSGDNYFVYPGENGPISSTRWELLRQGVQDFEALHLLKTRLGELKTQPERSQEAAKLEKSMQEIVAGAIDRDDCENIPDVGAARRRINRLLAEATGNPMNAPNPYQSNLSVTSRFSPEDFVPDGNLTKTVWQDAEWVNFDRDTFSQRPFPEAETEVASFWTATHVYFAFQCKYTTLNVYEGEDPAKERWELWNRDVVEVFANPEPERLNHYYEFEVAPNNQWIDLEIDLDKHPFNDAGWNSEFEHATRVDPQSRVWTCEMRIPVRTLNVRLMEANTEWRINFYRADGPGDDAQRRFLSWSPIRSEKRTFHTPTSFGLVRFVK